MDSRPNTGVVLEIQRMSTEDGPGIRTTVFMKGCPLRCAWCHNPESISPNRELIWTGIRCIGCGRCVESCPGKALARGESSIEINRVICIACGICSDRCPAGAMEMLGTEWHVEFLVEELVKDRAYFESSGGGVTVSGGESTLQAGFVAELLRELKKRGIHTALDTCGHCSPGTLDTLLPHTDLLLYDVKAADSILHKEFTGQSNEVIMGNLDHCCCFTRYHLYPREIWIRTPVIPGATDREHVIDGIGRRIASLRCGRITRWELCAFNNLCADKYHRLGKEWAYSGSSLVTADVMERLAGVARESGVDPSIVTWTGSTKSVHDPVPAQNAGTYKGRCGC